MEQECFSFEILAESSSDEEETMTEAVEEFKEEPKEEPETEAEVASAGAKEEREVRQLMDRVSNKRKLDLLLEDDPAANKAKLPAIEFQSPEANFPSIEAGSSSIKKKLEAIPMLDYDFCAEKTTAMDDSEEDERKPAARPEVISSPGVKSNHEKDNQAMDVEDPSGTQGQSDDETQRGACMFGGWGNKRSEKGKGEYDDLFSMEAEVANKTVPSAEILVAITSKEKHVFKSFRGLVDTGTLASLMDKALVPAGIPWVETGKQTQWKT